MNQQVEYQPLSKPSLYPLLYFFIILHGVAILGVVLFPPTWTILGISLLIANFFGLGMTLSFHRCLTHRAFTFKHKWLERVFATVGTACLQHGPIWWCGIHRLHHKYSDTSQDPHNSRRGFWYSHIFWLLHLDPQWNGFLGQYGYLNKVKDLSADPYYRWLDKLYFLPTVLFLLTMWLVGGWFWFFWGGVIPLVYNYHVTLSVNSLSHLFGYRSFKTFPSSDKSTNNGLVGILALGEGWHNNHHSFPASPKHGFFKWWEFDFTFLMIRLLASLGLVHSLRLPSDKQIESMKAPVLEDQGGILGPTFPSVKI